MIARLMCVVMVATLVGCATSAGLRTKLEGINGLSETDLVRSMGTPQQVYETEGAKFLTYSSSRFVMVPTASGSIGNTRSCQITFEINQGIVVGSTFKGNDCKA